MLRKMSSKRRSGVLLALGFLMALVSCSPKPKVAPERPVEVSTQVAPSHLTASAGNNEAKLAWRTNQPENRIISGYNIYQSRDGARFEVVTATPYPGDLDPGFSEETYLAAGLENGVDYRFRVSTVYPNGSEVFSADTASVIPRPEGQFRLSQSFKGAESGYSFAKMTAVPTDDLSNDIYLTSIKGKLVLASPHRIDVVLRETSFYQASEEQIKNLEQISTPLSGEKELTPIRAGDHVIVQTNDGHYALLTIDSVDIANAAAQISYIYQTRPRTLRF